MHSAIFTHGGHDGRLTRGIGASGTWRASAPMTFGNAWSLLRMAPAERALVFTVHGPIDREDLPGLCARVGALLGAARAGIAECDVATVAPNAVTVDALARLQLAARRFGCQVRLVNAAPELRALVGFMGLADVLPE